MNASLVPKALLFICGVLYACVDARAQPASGESPVITAATVRAPIVVDGVLDEEAWSTAPAIELKQQNPYPGKPTAYMTVTRVLRDDSYLYFGITCVDPYPSKIAVHTLQLDGDQSNDDAISIVLDSFGTKKLAYVFQVNAAGAMADGLLSPGSVASSSGGSGQSGVVNYYWNGYWRAAVRRTTSGWIAEIAIDTQSLQFDSHSGSWGFNIARYVPRDQLTLAWAGITLDASVFNQQWEGALDGLEDLKQGSGVEADPYVLARYDDQKTGLGTKAGGDIKYNFTPELAGLLTYDTDFSEAPVVKQRANLTRFALFVPEQRSFFLNGANVYDFSHDLGQNFIPFDSAKVGLVDDTIVPLDEGAKLIGDVGPWTLGFLDTQMAATGVSDSANLFAGRVSYNVDDEWRIGTLVTHGDPAGTSSNTFSGFDSTWSSSSFLGDKNLNLSGWSGHSSGDLPSGTPNGYGLDVEYPNDRWDMDLNYNFYGDALNPAIGFLPRPGTKQYYGQLDYLPRPDIDGTFGWVRQFQFKNNYTLVTGLDDHVQTELLNVYPLNFVTQTGWTLLAQLQSEYELIPASFSLAPGVTIPSGAYRYPSWGLIGTTPKSNGIWFSQGISAGGLYDGTYKLWQVELSTSDAEAHFTTDIFLATNYFYMPSGHFAERLATVAVSYAFNPSVAIATLAQYNNIRRSVGANTRLQWRIAPDRYLYLIWNHGVALSNDVNAIVLPLAADDNQVILKVVWGVY